MGFYIQKRICYLLHGNVFLRYDVKWDDKAVDFVVSVWGFFWPSTAYVALPAAASKHSNKPSLFGNLDTVPYLSVVDTTDGIN